MPKQVEQLFDNLRDNRFDEAKSLIKATPTLINALHPKLGCFLLETALIKGNKPFINFILTHSQFNYLFVDPKTHETILDMIITRDILDLDMAKLAIKHPKQLMNKGELSYARATEQLYDEESYAEQERIDNLTSVCNYLLQETIKHAKTTPELRDATILYAIRTDNVGIYNLLERAGISTSDRLGKFGNEKLPTTLLTAANPNLKAWYKARSEQAATGLSSNPHTLQNSLQRVKDLEAKLANLDVQEQSSKADLLKRGLSTDQKFITSAVAALR